MKHVCLYGGSFNPPHIGHFIMANEVYSTGEFDELRFMPTYISPHKQTSTMLSGEKRVELINLAIADIPYFSVETIELEKKAVSYTIDTIIALKEREPHTKFSFLIGADMVEYLPKWHRIDELLQLVSFVAVKRPGIEINNQYGITFVDAPLIDISSTYIRERLQQGKSIQFLVPESIRAKLMEVDFSES